MTEELTVCQPFALTASNFVSKDWMGWQWLLNEEEAIKYIKYA